MRGFTFLSEDLIGKTDEESMKNATEYLHEYEEPCQLGDIIVIGGFYPDDIKNKFGWDGDQLVPIYRDEDGAGVPAFVITDENGLQPDDWTDMLLDDEDVIVFFSQDIKNRLADHINENEYNNIAIRIQDINWRFYVYRPFRANSHNHNNFYFIDLQEALRIGNQEVKFYWHRHGGINIRIDYSFHRAKRFIELMTQFKGGTLYRKKKIIDELRNYRWMVNKETREILDNFYLKHIMKKSNRISMDIWKTISRY